MAYTLQLKRNLDAQNRNGAITQIKNYLGSSAAAEGEPVIATYPDGDTDKVVFGIKGINGYTIFDSEAVPSDVQDALDAAVADIKGGTDEEVNDAYDTIKKIADALVIINGGEDVEGSIAKAEKDAKDYTNEKIAALYFTDTAVAGQFVDSVSEADGVISVTRKPITSTDKSVVLDTANGVNLSVNVDGTTILRDGETGKLSVASAALVQYVGADAIKVSEVQDGNKTVSLTIDPNDKVLSQGADGLLATFSVAKLASATEGYAASYQLQDKEGNAMGVTIDIPKDMVIANAEVKEVEVADQPYSGAVVGDKYIDFTIANASSDHIYLPAKDLFDMYVAGNGIDITGNKITVKIDAATQKYVEVGANGVKIVGVDEALAKKVDWNDVSDIENPNRKTIQLNNHDSISGLATDGTGYNIAMVSKWDKVDLGAAGLEINLNGKAERPTYNDDKEIALLEDVNAVSEAAISVNAGNGISVTGDGTEKTITAVAKSNDPVIEVTADGIGIKENAVIDCGTY